MNKGLLIFLVGVFSILYSCGGGSSDPVSAPTLQVELQSSYKTDSSGSAEEWASAVANFQGRQEGFNLLGNSLATASADPSQAADWNTDTTYPLPGNTVKYIAGDKCGLFINAWWTLGDEPSLVPSSSNPWKIDELFDADCVTPIEDNLTDWDANGEYFGGTLVRYDGRCYEAKWWTKGDIPNPAPVNPWDTPWELQASCDIVDAPPIINPVGGGKIGIEQLPQFSSIDEVVLPDSTPVVPPTILALANFSESAVTADTELPATGYEFLRQVTTTHWDWLFPLRFGKYNKDGAVRNLPPIALEDGSTDVYTLANFTKAVLMYNAWAESKGYKQFLNEGTTKQQAQEFIAFWAKSARETSGSWATASAPWIVSYTNGQGETTSVWKGGIYWTEEQGFSSNDDGTSPAIGYVDSKSQYTAVSGRSYHGRGIIQLSWNYNYGPYSSWLFKNGFRPDLITSEYILLTRPDYVATYGDLAMLSGIWFWMTPQGPKPSCHDVLYGDVYNVSSATQEQGLPPRNDGGTISAAAGDTTDEAVMAYRIGAIINIVNGGIECNKAAAWHEGPMQRISYYNAFTMYFNDQLSGLNATGITDATNVWTQKVSDGSSDILKTVSCYAQRSYYSW
jgi:chitodextrinase